MVFSFVQTYPPPINTPYAKSVPLRAKGFDGWIYLAPCTKERTLTQEELLSDCEELSTLGETHMTWNRVSEGAVHYFQQKVGGLIPT